MEEKTSSILEVTSLKKRFKSVHAVKDISFSLEKGDIFAFLGPNGAGKTTTLRILLDIIKADSGKIKWNVNGKINHIPPSDQIGYLPEERGLYLDVSVIKSLVYLASIRGMDAAEVKKEAMLWLEKLELADRAKEKLQALSKGNQQKIQFIASILHKPAFAILDEPFSGLDPVNQEKFLQYIKELNEQGTTILLSSHQMLLVEKIAKKIFFINKGQQVFHGTLNDIYRDFGKQQILNITFASYNDIKEKLNNLPDVEKLIMHDNSQTKIIFKPNTNLNLILTELAKIEGIQNIRSENTNLHEIFLHYVNNY